ncbi:HAD-IA family hydrolase [Echinicola jeungdonensis]|uniref:HAD-IA family hydrolase n=1 Tax=Echinicola jeungdonensis TaxID=709343 RepID=A0ABV5J0E9_9BACT|nr:HAD-IA family hydrolase [Echinicola jeungdonensis]MDN3671099.1 HAD-IA family hydrolase [Echinicola jeungdonensis]
MKIDKNIDFFVFDLGGVIVDLNIPFTLNRLGGNLNGDGKALAKNFMMNPIQHSYEKGEIDDQTFRVEVKKAFQQDWTDQEVDDIWNAMLGGIPMEKIELLRELRKTHPIYMLSNTNGIHYSKVLEILLKDTGVESFDELFDHVFVSHHMGCRKPDAIIYEKVLDLVEKPAEKGMFFDDTEPNLIGAQKVGLQTCHINHPNALMEYFSDVQQ